MLSVILTILKVIGIIIAVLVGLILLIVLLVGFVPVRYKASGKYPAEGDIDEDVISRRKRDALMNKVKASDEKNGEETFGDHKKNIPVKANAVVSWLLHIVHISVDVDSTAFIITARLFGIFKIYSNDPETVKKKEEKRRKKEEKQRLKEEKQNKKHGKADDEADDEENKPINPDGADNDLGKVTDGKETDGKENSGKETDGKETADKEADKKEATGKKADGEEATGKGSDGDEETDPDVDFEIGDDETDTDEYKGIKGKFKKIADKFKGIIEKIKGIKEKIRSLCKKKDYVMNMKDDPRVRSGLMYGKEKLFLIIKRVLPKKLEGRVAYGLEDPSTTGKILAGVSIFYPVWGGHFELEPDFERKRLEADINLKGRIILALLVIPAVKVWFNKDIKYIRRKIRGFKKL